MSSIPHIQSWVDFFETLKELPELWNIKSELFKDRNKKNNAWTKLLEVYKHIDHVANVDSLKKRLTNIKTCYRRELKKVEQSQRSGAGAEEEYVPSLWYFELLEFLRDQEVQIPGISTIDHDLDAIANNDQEQSTVNEGSEHSPAAPSSSSCSVKRKKSAIDHMAERNDLLKEALGRLTNSKTNKDDASIFAESWATSYRKLSTTQQIYAKKAIEEILVLGQLELLSLNSISHYSNNSPAPSSAPSTSSHHSSLQESRSSTPFQQTHSYATYENIIPIQMEPSIYSNVQQLLSDNNFS